MELVQAYANYIRQVEHPLPLKVAGEVFDVGYKNKVDDFIKKSSIVYYSREALEPIHKDIISFAEAERLTAHANSIKVRFED